MLTVYPCVDDAERSAQRPASKRVHVEPELVACIFRAKGGSGGSAFAFELENAEWELVTPAGRAWKVARQQKKPPEFTEPTEYEAREFVSMCESEVAPAANEKRGA